MNRYTVRISVTERKPANGPAAAFGASVPDKLLDATVTTDNLDQIRTMVDGLIFEGIPDTQREDEKEPTLVPIGTEQRGVTVGAGYRLVPDHLRPLADPLEDLLVERVQARDEPPKA